MDLTFGELIRAWLTLLCVLGSFVANVGLWFLGQG